TLCIASLLEEGEGVSPRSSGLGLPAGYPRGAYRQVNPNSKSGPDEQRPMARLSRDPPRACYLDWRLVTTQRSALARSDPAGLMADRSVTHRWSAAHWT